MGVKPYQTRSGYLYIPCKRGDGIIADGALKQSRLFDGMCGGYIDPDQWQTPPILSAHNQGETLWIEIPKTSENLKFAQDAGKPENEPSIEGGKVPLPTNYRCMSTKIDFTSLDPFVRDQCPDFLNKIWALKYQIPVIQLDKINASCIKDAQTIDIDKAAIEDVGSVTSGSYTVGAVGDYATLGGAGGAFAAVGNLTGNLTFTVTSAITETGVCASVAQLGGYTLKVTSDTPHYGSPNAGYLVSVNTGANFFANGLRGAGTLEISHLNIKCLNVDYPRCLFYLSYSTVTHTVLLHDLLIDGNGRCGYGIFQQDSMKVYLYNTVLWDCTWKGIYLNATATTSIFENVTMYNCTGGANFNSRTFTVNNFAAYGTTCFVLTGSATGNNNSSSNTSAANANWASGSNNITNAIVANDVISTTDTNDDFMNIKVGGPLVSTGITNTITARTTCIRGNPVPNAVPATSIGAAEIISPAPKSSYSWNVNMP